MFCPKCHRPTEDGEVYICCGDATLQWRCSDCGKVSEGFAFPYGMCPLCSGRLEMLDNRMVDGDDAVAAIRTAFEIELGGHAFYLRASQETQEPVLRELFGRFAEMEQAHMDTLARRYHADVPEPSPEFRLDRAAVFAGIEHRPADPASLFRTAIAFEERAVKFFTDRSAQCAAGSVESELYKELAAEEREHAALLATEFDRWAEGKPGLL